MANDGPIDVEFGWFDGTVWHACLSVSIGGKKIWADIMLAHALCERDGAVCVLHEFASHCAEIGGIECADAELFLHEGFKDA